MVRPDRHAVFPSQIRENLASGGAVTMCLDGAQSGIAQRYRLCRVRSTPSAACGGRRRRGSRRSPSSAPLRGIASSEPRQHTLGDFQLIELGAQLCPFGVEPREPLGDLLLLLSNLVQCRHLLSPSSPIPTVIVLHRYFAINGRPLHRKKMSPEKLLPFYGCPRTVAVRQGATSSSSEARAIRSLLEFCQRFGRRTVEMAKCAG